MYRQNKMLETTLEVNDSVEGETIETKIERILTNNEPITDGAQKIYTERKDGVLPEYDIRTDRFEVAVEAMDYVSKSNTAKREAKMTVEKTEKSEESTKKGGEKDSGAESTQGTSNSTD